MATSTTNNNFVKKKYPLTIEIVGEGTVTEAIIKQGVTTSYNSGTIVELTADSIDEWEFVEWKGDLTGTENPKNITIDKAKSVKAVFEKELPFLFFSIKMGISFLPFQFLFITTVFHTLFLTAYAPFFVVTPFVVFPIFAELFKTFSH